MSIQAVGWALDQDLPARPKLVLVSLANHADHTNGYCWLKADTIAAEAACTPRSVYRFIGALIRNGFVRKAPRRGADGKQRATDYWILLDRPEKAWEWLPQEDDPRDAEADSEVAENQDVVVPDDNVSPGENGDSEAENLPEIPALSCGPGDSRVTDKRIAEPSKTNPKEAAREGPQWRPSVPRRYKPPPVAPEQPQGTLRSTGHEQQVFVFVGTRAWDAWCDHKQRERGVRWTLTRTIVESGKAKTGWWFPSLFPPKATSTGPPRARIEGTLATDDDLKEFARG